MPTPGQARIQLDQYENVEPVPMGRNLRAIERGLNMLPVFPPQRTRRTNLSTGSTTSTTNVAVYANFPFDKAEPWTQLDIDFRTSWYSSAGGNAATFSIAIADTTYEIGTSFANAANVHLPYTERILIARGLTPGTHAAQLLVKVDGGQFNVDTNDGATIIVTESI